MREIGDSERTLDLGYPLQLVTFIDVLGFKRLVKHSDAAEVGAILEQLSIHAAAEQSRDITIMAGGSASDRHVYKFSDTILRSFRLPNADPSALSLFAIMEVLDMAIAQWMLAQRGILIRGAITSGGLVSGPDVAYGPALVKAYELESESAIHPRVLVDSTLFASVIDSNFSQDKKIEAIRDGLASAVDVDSKDLEQNYEYDDFAKRPVASGSWKCNCMTYLATGPKGIWWIDYLRFANHSLPHKQLRKLGVHKEAVATALAETEPQSREREKLEWLASYHNRQASELCPSGDLCVVVNGACPCMSNTLELPWAVRVRP